MKIPFTFSLLMLLLSFPGMAQMGAGTAVQVDGSSTYAEVNHAASLNPSSAISIEAWIKPTAFGNNLWENVIVSKDDWTSGENG